MPRTLVALFVLGLGSLPGCMTGLLISNTMHMTVDRAAAKRVEKRFRVLDAETGQPLPGAWVTGLHNFDWMDDWTLGSATADAEGIATLKVASDYIHLLLISAGAEGYLWRDDLRFGDRVQHGGVGAWEDDPTDIYIYRAPPTCLGLRLPVGFRGLLERGTWSATRYETPCPPDFPQGQRIWWTDYRGPGTIYQQPPPLGRHSGPSPAMVYAFADGTTIPVPAPGAELDGLALWRIGVRTDNGPWGGTHAVTLVGDRADAVKQAQIEWQHHGNGDKGYIYNGWLRLVAPSVKTNQPGLAEAVTRPRPRK